MDKASSTVRETDCGNSGEEDSVDSGETTKVQTTPELSGTPVSTPDDGGTPATTTGVTTPADKDLPVLITSSDAINAIDAISVVDTEITVLQVPQTGHSGETTEPLQSASVTETAVPQAESNAEQPSTSKPDDASPTVTTDSKSEKAKKPKQRVVKTTQSGIYTLRELESSNFFVEWYRGFIISSPYMLRLIKIFWSLSPSRASILISTNLVKAVLPSIQIWVTKQFLDQVQKASDKPAVKNIKALLLLGMLKVATRLGGQGLEVISYVSLL